jgi:hypothetical protein
MNRSTVISMVQDLTEHRADERLDFNNLFNLRLVKFIQEEPFWWRKKIFSFTTVAGIPTYDFNNFPTPGLTQAIIDAQFTAGTNGVLLSFSGSVPGWLIPGAQIAASLSDSRFNGGPWTVVSVTPGSPNVIGLTVNLGSSSIAQEAVTGQVQQIYPTSLASDLESFLKVTLWLNGQKLGQMEPNFDIESIADAQQDALNSSTWCAPGTYCIEPDSQAPIPPSLALPTLTTMRLMNCPDQPYLVVVSYMAVPQLPDDCDDDIIPLIPPMYHHALVSGLKMDVTGFLFGEKSDLYSVSQSEYQESVQKAIARQDISAAKKLQFIVREESVRSTVGGYGVAPGDQVFDTDVIESGFNQ